MPSTSNYINASDDSSESKSEENNASHNTSVQDIDPSAPITNVPKSCTWINTPSHFMTQMCIPEEQKATIIANVDRKSFEVDILFTLFPKSLFNYIA